MSMGVKADAVANPAKVGLEARAVEVEKNSLAQSVWHPAFQERRALWGGPAWMVEMDRLEKLNG
jgi:hypothetical protein